MQPYIIKQGDHLALLAYKFGFRADAVWNDPANDDLRKIRPDPNILWPTDVLQIPEDDGDAVTHDLVVGATNSFVCDCPTMSIRLKFSGAAFASRAVTVPELPELTGLTTGADGTLALSVPVTQGAFTVVFDEQTTFACKVANLDPLNTLSGVVQRLQNLGFLSPRLDVDAIPLDDVRSALGVLLAMHSTDDDKTSASADGSDDPDQQDYAVMLSDDGELDDAAAKVLLRVHGA